jgi:hypothetical protein
MKLRSVLWIVCISLISAAYIIASEGGGGVKG